MVCWCAYASVHLSEREQLDKHFSTWRFWLGGEGKVILVQMVWYPNEYGVNNVHLKSYTMTLQNNIETWFEVWDWF